MTFEEISQRWKNSYLGDGKPLALRTFHTHREAVAELFGVEIKCDTSTYEYYLSSPSELKSDTIKQWLINSFTISNMIEAGHNMHDRILFEEIPGGTEYLQDIIDAMQRNKTINIEYHPFNSKLTSFNLQPYAMKVYHQRWYIVGYIKETCCIRNIALDRILNMEITDDSFIMPDDFDAEGYYAHTVGIFINDKLKPQIIIIRAYGVHVKYLRTLPLHFTQQEIFTKEDEYSDFQYYLYLTPELTTQFITMGERVEVLEPIELRNDVKERLTKSLERYK